MTHFTYNGSDKIGLLDYIDVVSKMQNGISSYDIRVVNADNGDVIVEKNGLSNTNYETVDLGTLINIPTSESIMEVEIRRVGGNGNKDVYIQQVAVYYGN